MIAFRILFAIDILIALVVLYFFFEELSDGSVSSFNMLLWLALIGAVALPLVLGGILKSRGNIAGAGVVLAVLAVPGFLIGLFFLLLLSLPGNFR